MRKVLRYILFRISLPCVILSCAGEAQSEPLSFAMPVALSIADASGSATSGLLKQVTPRDAKEYLLPFHTFASVAKGIYKLCVSLDEKPNHVNCDM